MYKLTLLPFLLIITLTAIGQNKANIKGRVIDSINNTPVEFATVAVLDVRDTTSNLVAYTLTDKTGAFALHNLPSGVPLKILISFVAYQPYRKLFTLGKTETLDLGIIHVSPKQLNEVTIKSDRMPIVVRKDTIEFDAEAFKVRPNAVVEDLLKKLPGVEIDNQGQIKVMGKEVTKVLVDGREFFPSDVRMATKNLDADLIAKVQVYDDRENDPDHIVPESQVKKIINLKFKAALKKSIFGKVYAGQGTQDHYQAGGLFNLFRDTLQVSLLGLTNNLNSTGFDFNDLYMNGGVNRGGDAFQRGGFGFGNGPTGKQTATTAGININTDYGKKLKINLNYLYKHTQTSYSTITGRQQFLGDTTDITNSTSNRQNNNDNHYLSGTVNWHPSDASQIRYSPLLTISQNSSNSIYNSYSFSNFINPINNTVNSGNSSGNTFQFEQSLNYNYQLKKKGSSINIDHSLHINPNHSLNYDNNALQSFIATFPSYVLNRLGDNNNKNFDVSLSGSYRDPLSKKITADVSVSNSYSNQLNKVATFDFDPATGQYDTFLQIQSSDLTRNRWEQDINPGITWNIVKDLSLTAHAQAQFQQLDNIFDRNSPDINRNYFYVLPNASLNYKNLSLNYNKSVQLPNIGDMIPYSVVFSPLSTVTGNPGLKPTTRDNYSVSYRKYNFQGNGISYTLSGNASFEQNSIFRERTLDANLAETSTPINRNGRYNYGINASLSKNFKKRNDLQIFASTNINANRSHDFFVLNHKDGLVDNYIANISEHVQFNWKDIIQIDPQYTITGIRTSYTGVDYNNPSTIRHEIDAHFNIYYPKHMNVEGNYNYAYNPLVPAGFQKHSNLLSISLARQFLKKDRGEVKLSCYDILNQNISYTRNIDYNSITDTQSQIIKRYFMLTLQFKFNKSTVKEDIRKPGMGPLLMRLPVGN